MDGTVRYGTGGEHIQVTPAFGTIEGQYNGRMPRSGDVTLARHFNAGILTVVPWSVA